MMVRVCSHSDSECRHGMACPYSCATNDYRGEKLLVTNEAGPTGGWRSLALAVLRETVAVDHSWVVPRVSDGCLELAVNRLAALTTPPATADPLALMEERAERAEVRAAALRMILKRLLAGIDNKSGWYSVKLADIEDARAIIKEVNAPAMADGTPPPPHLPATVGMDVAPDETRPGEGGW